MSESRKVSKASSRFLAKERSPLFYGTDIPSSVSRKEIIDNEIDVISESKMSAKQAVIKISPRRLQVMDDGPGISTEPANGAQTNLWLAIAELFTSSNYEGEKESLGNNGVGLSLGVLTSQHAVALNFNGNNVKGYEFKHGLLKGTPGEIAESSFLDNVSSGFTEEDKFFDKVNHAFTINKYNEIDDLVEVETKEDSVKTKLLESVTFKGKYYEADTIFDGTPRELLDNTGVEYDEEKFNEFLKKYSRSSFANENDSINDKLGCVVDASEAYDGDYVSNPLSYEAAYERFVPPFKNGFMVDITWGSEQDPVFPDGGKADLKWLHNYTKRRVGEMSSGGIVEFYVYADDDFTKLVSHEAWTNRDELSSDYNSENDSKQFQASRNAMFDKLTIKESTVEYIPSWLDQVKAYNAVVYRVGDYWVAFSTDEEMKVDSIVQGAPVTSRFDSKQTFEIEGQKINVSVPTSFKYESETYPPYSDQTKVRIKYPGVEIRTAFDKRNEVNAHFYHQAEMIYAESLVKDANPSIFWEALGDPEEAELIIGEGFSSVSNIKSQRDPYKQACIAIRGKILNTWRSDIKYAMRSEEAKEILNAVLYTNYKRIIFATDADPDGYHISTLLIGLLYQFTNKIQEGKVCYAHTPYYVFKKRNEPELWSDDPKDCPAGYHKTTLKGLGSLTPEQMHRFVTNEETRQLIYIKDNDKGKSEEALDIALVEGGKRWIIE